MKCEHKNSQVEDHHFKFYEKLFVYFSKILNIRIPCFLGQVYFSIENSKLKSNFKEILIKPNEVSGVLKRLHEIGIGGIKFEVINEGYSFKAQLDWVRLSHIKTLGDYLVLFKEDFELAEKLLSQRDSYLSSEFVFLKDLHPPEKSYLCFQCDYKNPIMTTFCFACGFSLVSPVDQRFEVHLCEDTKSSEHEYFFTNYLQRPFGEENHFRNGQLVIRGVSEKIANFIIDKANNYNVRLGKREVTRFSDLKSTLIKTHKLKELTLKNFNEILWYKRSIRFFRIHSLEIFNNIKSDIYKVIWFIQEKEKTVNMDLVDAFEVEYERLVQMYEEFQLKEEGMMQNQIIFNHAINHITEIYLDFVSFRNLMTEISQSGEVLLFEKLKKIYESIASYESTLKIIEHRKVS